MDDILRISQRVRLSVCRKGDFYYQGKTGGWEEGGIHGRTMYPNFSLLLISFHASVVQ